MHELITPCKPALNDQGATHGGGLRPPADLWVVRGMRSALASTAALLAIGTLATLSGCAEPTSSAGVTGYNHTSNRSIYTFGVNGSMGMPLGPEEGGGGTSCCATIPSQWRPGINVKVRWEYQNFRDIPAPQPEVREAEVELPRYIQNDIGRIAVHFFPDHKIKVVVTSKDIGHPQYPDGLNWGVPTPPDAVQAIPQPLNPPQTHPSPTP